MALLSMHVVGVSDKRPGMLDCGSGGVRSGTVAATCSVEGQLLAGSEPQALELPGSNSVSLWTQIDISLGKEPCAFSQTRQKQSVPVEMAALCLGLRFQATWCTWVQSLRLCRGTRVPAVAPSRRHAVPTADS